MKMAWIWWDVAAIAAAAIAGYIFAILRSWSTPRMPPGPPALPVLGHLHLLGELPHQSMYNLSKKYGTLMGLRLGCKSAIVASSPYMAKQILGKHDLAFSDRPATAAAVRVLDNCSDVAFCPNHGPRLKYLRQLLATEFFSAKRLLDFEHVRVDEIRSLLPLFVRLGDSGKRSFRLRPCLVSASDNITCRMMTGSKLSELMTYDDKDDGDGILEIVDELMYLFGVFNVGDFIPFVDFLDLQGYRKRMDALSGTIHRIFQKVINKRRSTNKSPPANPDLLDKMIEAAGSNLKSNVIITDKDIIAMMLDLVVGGSDTSAVTVEWALAELINHPTKLQKVQEELDNVVGHARLVNEYDIPNLSYLSSVVKETMRLHPPAPLLIPHMSSKEVQLEGFLIPPKTLAYINVWAIGRDHNSWECPLEFNPERFINSSLDTKGQNFELLPFGTGRRSCPGRALGLLITHLMLATILQGFNLSLSKQSQVTQDMSEACGITTHMKNSLCPLATPRLPKDLYETPFHA